MSAAANATLATAPSTSQVDMHAIAYQILARELEEALLKAKEAGELVSTRHSELIDLVRSFGGPHATKSKILHGVAWEIVATFGQYVSQDAAAVERFRLALAKAKQTRLLKKIFTADTRWTMRADAGQVLAAEEKLSPKKRAELMALLLLCSRTGDKKPSLDVREKKKASA